MKVESVWNMEPQWLIIHGYHDWIHWEAAVICASDTFAINVIIKSYFSPAEWRVGGW